MSEFQNTSDPKDFREWIATLYFKMISMQMTPIITSKLEQMIHI